MKIIKKNQLAILVIALMLITAGYLNYDTTYNGKMAMDASSELNQSLDLAALGDAELVNANLTEENGGEKKEEETTSSNNSSEQAKTPETQVTNSQANGTQGTSSDYFAKSKLERNVMYSQMTSRYQEIIANSSQAPEQKAVAQEEINKINDLQNAIMIAENLLTSKGFDNNIIFVNGDSVSVIIGKENLGQDEVAQIQNIISRELKAELSNIHISMK